MRAMQSRVVGPVLRHFADPQKILEQGMAFWSSRVVLTAVEFGVFTELAGEPLSAPELMKRFGWHPRAAGPFLDALVGMGLLRRNRAGLYSNSVFPSSENSGTMVSSRFCRMRRASPKTTLPIVSNTSAG